MAIDDPDEQGGDGEDPGEADEASSTSDGDAVGEEPDPGDVADKLKEAVRSGASLNDAMTDTTADDDAYAVGQSVGEKGGLSTDDSDDAPTRSGAPDGTEEAGEVWGEDQSSRAATDNEREPGEADGVNESPLVEGSSLELDRENVDQSAAQDRQITDVRGPPGGTEEAVPEPVEFTPATVRDRLGAGATIAKTVHAATAATASGPPMVAKDEYTWAHFKVEYYYDEDGNPPRDDEDEVIPFDPSSYLRFDPSLVRSFCAHAGKIGDELGTVVDERTLDVPEDLDEDAFFSTVEGHTTIVNRYDLERAVDIPKKGYFREVERYWVNKPFAFVVIYHSEKENEKKYYLIEPYATPVEEDLMEFLTEKLRTAIKYAEEGVVVEGTDAERREVIERETRRLLERYDLYTGPERDQREFTQELLDSLGFDGDGNAGRIGALLTEYGLYEPPETDDTGEVEGLSARPEPAILEEDPATLSEYQVEKLLYALKRNFIGYERIDGIKHDINVEDISCDGYNSPVFAYHTDYEQLITNVRHGESSLDDFVVKMAQRAGKGISKRQPQVDATLPDGSRAQLTLGTEVSDHGTNYTIRQFKDVPFTPVDLINWKTFSLDEMAFLWLCIENNKSLLFAGGTASGKTTSLNAVSLFIPSNAKIVSIEDTREVELPQRNWIASVTRPSFGEDETGDIDEFDLLEAALRQRPDYIIMGEVRGEEGRTLFQVMSTGHTTYTTFHADNVSEVIKRFTTDPINVSKTLFTALDLISIQAQTRIRGKKVRRSRNITEIRRYDPENDEINVNDVFQWRPETDTYRRTAESTTLDEIKFDRGWTEEELDRKLFERRTVLAFLIENGLNTYAEVAATVQAYINDPETILTLIANGQLQDALADLRGMESVLIDVDEEKEEMVPRPDPDEETRETATEILDRAEEDLFPEYRGETAPDISEALTKTPEDNVVVGSTPGEGTVEGRDTATGEATEDGLDEFVDVDEALSDGAAETHEREGNSTGWEAAEGGDFQVDDSSDESHDPDETDGGEGER